MAKQILTTQQTFICNHCYLFRKYHTNSSASCFSHLTSWKKERKWSHSVVRLFATPWTVAYQAPKSVEFSRQEYWSGLPFPSPGDFLKPGIEPRSPALQADALLSEPLGKPNENPSNLFFLILWQNSFPGGSVVKEPACQSRRCTWNSCIWKIPWRKKCQLTPVFLPGESHGQRSLVGYNPWGCKELGTTEHTHTHTHITQNLSSQPFLSVTFSNVKVFALLYIQPLELFHFAKLNFHTP